MQRVDPFIPVSRPHHPSPAQPLRARPEPPKHSPGVIDGYMQAGTARAVLRPPPVQAAGPAAAPAVPAAGPLTAVPHQSEPMHRVETPSPAAVTAPLASSRPARPKRRALRGTLSTAGLIAVVLLTGTAAQTLAVGEVMIAAYAVYVLVRRVPSRTTFMLALVSLAAVAVMQIVGKDAMLASNFAVYAFLLAFVGVATLAREVRRTKV